MSRRLPVYFVLDCSESMVGPALDSVTKGVKALVEELSGNPLALETAYISVITFAREAKQLIPLTELLDFKPPKLSARTGTSLGAALRLLAQCLKSDVVRTTEKVKGDYKPLVFLLTDGQPTDVWESTADALKSPTGAKLANIYAIGCGPDVDIEVLYRITDTVVLMPELSPESIKKLFVWLSASVQTASLRVETGGGTDNFELPKMPTGLEVPAKGSQQHRDTTPFSVFLHARCSSTKQPYLMRFARRQYEHRYDAVGAYPLEVLEDDDADLLPPISSTLLAGCPSCPYCENPVAAMCPCGALFCEAADSKGPSSCPRCGARLSAGTSGEFDIKRSQG